MSCFRYDDAPGVDDGDSFETAGFFEPGSDYVISARPPDIASGERFTGWTNSSGTRIANTTTSPVGLGGSGLFGDAMSLTTRFTMPEYDSVVTATYITAIPEPSLFSLLFGGFLASITFRRPPTSRSFALTMSWHCA